MVGIGLVPYFTKGFDRRRSIIHVEPYGTVPEAIIVSHDTNRRDGFAKRIVIEIFQDAGNGRIYFATVNAETFPYYILCRCKPEFFYECFVDQESTSGVSWQKISSGYKLQSKNGSVLVVGILQIYLPGLVFNMIVKPYTRKTIRRGGGCFVT